MAVRGPAYSSLATAAGDTSRISRFSAQSSVPLKCSGEYPEWWRDRPVRFTVDSATGLRLSWFVYRGKGTVVFDPVQVKVWEDTRDNANSPWSYGWRTPPVPPDGKWVARATFREPGTYVLRCQAHDGGLATTGDVTFVVTN